MDKLLQPDIGLILCTAVTFLLLVAVLGKFAWAPLLQALKSREDGIRRAIEDAEKARKESEALRVRYEQELARGQEKVEAILNQAQKDAQQVRDRILKEAEAESARLSSTTQRQLEEEKAKILRDVRKEVASLSILAAEKLVRHDLNAKVQDELLQDFFQDLDKQKSKELN